MEQVATDIETNPEKSFLIIMNTIKSSQQLYQHLQNRVDKENLVYLSTMIFPKERLNRSPRYVKVEKEKLSLVRNLLRMK